MDSSFHALPEYFFVDPADLHALVLGEGQAADGTWKPIGLQSSDLMRVLHIIGRMGSGKSRLLQDMVRQLVHNGAGGLILDCRSAELVIHVLPDIPLDREQDVTLLALGQIITVTGEDLHIPLSPLTHPSPTAPQRMSTADFLAQALTPLWCALYPPFHETLHIKQLLVWALRVLLQTEPQPTLSRLCEFFTQWRYHQQLLSQLDDWPDIRYFWEERYPQIYELAYGQLHAFLRVVHRWMQDPLVAMTLDTSRSVVDLQYELDHQGIVLAHVAPGGNASDVLATALLVQVIEAAPRWYVPRDQRAVWPVIIDEAQLFGTNIALAQQFFSMLPSQRVGVVVAHQGLDQLGESRPVILANAHHRVILVPEVSDVPALLEAYPDSALTHDDFAGMHVTEDQFISLHGVGTLVASRRRSLADSRVEDVSVVDQDWRAIRAPTQSPQDEETDAVIAELRALVQQDRAAAVAYLGVLCRDKPKAFAAYCARTRAHRLAQRAFILEHRGCIPDKVLRIQILSALKIGVPCLETEAERWARPLV